MARMSGMALEGPRKAARIATLSAHQTKLKVVSHVIYRNQLPTGP
jgi:hypothetical protein